MPSEVTLTALCVAISRVLTQVGSQRTSIGKHDATEISKELPQESQS